MGTITVTRALNVDAARAWGALADFGNIANFHPDLSGSRLLNGSANEGVGAERRCDLKDRNYLVERVLDWQDGRSYTVDIVESSMPLRSATATLSVREIDAHHSEATMTINMTMKFGLVGKIMEVLMVRAAMKRSMAGILRGLDDFVGTAPASTGQPISAPA
jgi:hypothetical protein